MFLLADLVIFAALDHWGPFHFPIGDGRVATLALPWQRETPAQIVDRIVVPVPAQMRPKIVASEFKALLEQTGADVVTSAPAPHATVYKCRSESGGVLFQDTPCAVGRSAK